jgi:hypothetical protein
MIKSDLIKMADDFYNQCLQLIKESKIRKMPDGKYRVLSQKGKNLGTYKSRAGAEKRLKQVEFFKHLDNSKADDSTLLDLTDVDDYSYSAFIRKIRERGTEEQLNEFLNLYKKFFDNAIKKNLQKPEKIALQKTLIKFNKSHKIKIDKKIVKSAAVSELGDPVTVGNYLANIIKFTLGRISVEKRPSAIESLKKKIYYLNETELASKNMPASSAIGQSLTFIKHVLFNHDASYIREVLNNIVRFL